MAAKKKTRTAKGHKGSEDRTADGRFVKGHKSPGPGNPHAQQVNRLRSALMSAVTPDDMKAVIAALIRKARTGDVPACKELFDRVIGKPKDVPEDKAPDAEDGWREVYFPALGYALKVPVDADLSAVVEAVKT